MLEQQDSRHRAVLSLPRPPGFSFLGTEMAELRADGSLLCFAGGGHSPGDLKLMVATRRPDPVVVAGFGFRTTSTSDKSDACGLRRLKFTSPEDLEQTLDAELHRKGRGPGRRQWGKSDHDAGAGSPIRPRVIRTG